MKQWCFILTICCCWSAFAEDKIPELEIEALTQDIYLHRSFNLVDGFGLVSSNGLVVIKQDKAFIIDTPWSIADTEKLVQWLEAKNLKVSGSLSTHSHEDRTAGIKWLNDHAIPTYATSLTNSLLQKDAKELATLVIDSNPSSLAEGEMEVFYPGGGHTIDNVVVWISKSQLLFGGCFVRALQSTGLGYTGEASIEQWPQSVDKLLNRYPEVNIVIPGHGKPGDQSLLLHTKILAEQANTAATKKR